MRIGRTQFQLAIWARMIFTSGPLGLLERERPPEPF
jgi:hypothetical protein